MNAPEREIVLPELPLASYLGHDSDDGAIYGHYSEDVRAYARTAILADREAGARAGQGEAQWKSLAESLIDMIGEISKALGIDDESQETANGAGEILDAIDELKVCAAAQPPTHAASPDVEISEYDGLPLDAMPEPDDWRYLILAARCRDLLHLLSFADIKTPSEGDAGEAAKVMAGIRHLINTEGAATQASSAVGAEGRESDQQLMRFYSVETISALIDAQERHITKLQAKIPPLRDELPRNPRIG